MAVLRLGFLTTLLSDPVIQGFTTGSAFHVATSQVEYMFGLGKHVDKYSGPLSIFKVRSPLRICASQKVRSTPAMPNHNALLSQSLCHYRNEGRTLHGLFSSQPN